MYAHTLYTVHEIPDEFALWMEMSALKKKIGSKMCVKNSSFS